ncbi:MAG: hypothetical protein HGA87_04465 [Desulfobulbaceae bacterium]|jgi:hypothetical protein|nr:hypothetical protein [Desulfobulbaceae bacterium]
MSVHTHTSSWRLLLTFAPVFGVGCILMFVIQGDIDAALTRTVYLVLAPVSLAGWLTGRQMRRVLSERPVIPIADAKAGDVAFRGKATAIPNRPLLLSPNGESCVWYRNSKTIGRTYSALDSEQPFLLTDASGSCIVLPSKAEISGGHNSSGLGGTERLILSNDMIYVAGCFKPASPETVKLIQNVEPEPYHISVTMTTDDPKERCEALERAKQAFYKRAAQSAANTPTDLPVVCAPGFGPFFITADDGKNDADWYALLTWVNLFALLGSTMMTVYLTLVDK